MSNGDGRLCSSSRLHCWDEEDQEGLWELKASPAWEEEEDDDENDDENGKFDPTEERRLSGTDPVSLWGDILS